MAQPARAPAASWPISPSARDALAAEADRLAAELAADLAMPADPFRPGADGGAGETLAARPGDDGAPAPVRLPVRGARERLAVLRDVLDAASVAADAGVVAIGRRATLLEEGGSTWTCSLVLPGDGDAEHGWVSAGSPLGSALLGRRAGETAFVHAPGGAWPVTVVAVEEPSMLDGCPTAPAAQTAPPAPRRPRAARRP